MTTKGKMRDWWLIFERAALVISLAINIVLWFQSQEYKFNVDSASYNDLAWGEKARFLENLDTINVEYSEKIDELLSNPIADVDSFSATAFSLKNEWKQRVIEAITELKSKLGRYEAVTDLDQNIRQFAANHLFAITSPSYAVINNLKGRIVEREELFQQVRQTFSGVRAASQVLRKTKKMREFSKSLESTINANRAEFLTILNS